MAHGSGRQRHQGQGRQDGKMGGEILAHRHGLDWRRRRRSGSARRAAGPAGPAKPPLRARAQGERGGQPADQRQASACRPAGWRPAPARLGRSRPKATPRKGASTAERQAGHNPVSRAFGQRRQLERPGRQQQEVERAVLVVGREQAVERQQRGEQRGAPQHAGGDARQHVGLRARCRAGNSTVATTKKASTTATSPGRRQTRRRSRATRAVKPVTRSCPARARADAACRDRHGWRRWRGRRRARWSRSAVPQRRLRRRIERVQRLVEQPQRAPATAPRGRAPRGGAGRPTGCAPAGSPELARSKAASAASSRSCAGGAPRRRSATSRFSRTERSPFRPSRWPSQASRPRQVSRLGLHVGALPADGAGVGPHQQGERAQQGGLAAAVAAGRAPKARPRPGRRTGARTPAGRRGGRPGRSTSEEQGGAMRAPS